MRQITIVTLFFGLFLPELQSHASSVLIDVTHGQSVVSFEAVGRPSMLRITGKSSKTVQGNFVFDGKNITGICTFELDSLSTGIATRDEHMKSKYLETGKYPKSVLTVSQLFTPATLTVDSAPFQGSLLLHGITKPVTGTFSLAPDTQTIQVTAKFVIQVDDFGIPQASFSGITMAKEVKLIVTVKAPLRNDVPATAKR